MNESVSVEPKELSNADRCVDEIVRRIRSGKLKPSHRLGEDSIARELGIGRAPVRIAFERLVSQGILEREHRAGTFVRSTSLEEWCAEMDVRAVLEGLAARLASERATPEQLAQLRELAGKVDNLEERLAKQTNPDGKVLAELELTFHTEVAKLSGNRSLVRMLFTQHVLAHCLGSSISLPANFTPSQFVVPGQQTVVTDATHREIVDAMVKRDADTAERLLRAHVLFAKQSLVSHMLGTMGLNRGATPSK